MRPTRAAFRWQIPARYNIGADVCDRWADAEPDRLALIDVTDAGAAREVTFGDLRRRAEALCHALARRGVARGDRVGVLLPQGVETAASHVAALRMGAVSVPLFTLFGAEALLHRLRDSGAAVILTNAEGAARLAPLRADLPDLAHILCTDGARDGAEDYRAACAESVERFPPVETGSGDPALLIYTSGTTGPPKGALHAHRVLLGHLPGVEISHDFLPQPGDRIWTPADWAWIGGLLDVLMPALHHGVPVVARRFSKFTAREAFALMERYGVRNAFLPPTALKMMRRMEAAPRLSLRSVASGGEAVGPELLDWGREVLGCTINEFYGQTECNMIVSACAALEPPVRGFIGRAVPGHDLALLDPATGATVPRGSEGEIAVRAPDPVMFLRYWNRPDATEEKFVVHDGARWLLTGDRGRQDASGRFAFVGRGDDVIGSGGYRIGPGEVEDCLLGHPAVALAGVVGLPDETRGQIVAAFVTLTDGYAPSDALADEIAAHVKERLAAHEYPRIVPIHR